MFHDKHTAIKQIKENPSQKPANQIFGNIQNISKFWGYLGSI